MPKEEIHITNFRGVYTKASRFNQPNVFAETCQDFLITHEGKLVKRQGYRTAYLYSVLYATTGLSGTLLGLIELQTGQPAPDDLKYLAFTSASNGALYLWTPGTGTWAQIDGDISDFRNAAGTVEMPTVMQENGALRLLAGNRSVNYSIWWGYCGDRFLYAISATAGTNAKVSGAFKTTASLADISTPSAATYLDVTKAAPPAGVTWTRTILDEAVDSEGHVALYLYFVSLQYDWGAWSALSEMTIDASATSDLYTLGTQSKIKTALKLTLPAATDQRVTGVRIWRSRIADSEYVFPSIGVPYLLAELNLNAPVPTLTSNADRIIWPATSVVSAVYTAATKTFKLVATYADDTALADDLLNGATLIVVGGTPSATYYCLVTDTVFTATDNQTIVVADGTGLVDGTTYALYAVSAWYKSGTDYILALVDAISESVIQSGQSAEANGALLPSQLTTLNAKYGTIINGLALYANCYHYGETKPWLVAYGAISADGLIANDVHAVLNAFAVDSDINGISSIGSRLIVYTGVRIYRGVIPNTNEATWELEKVFDQYGLLAPKSLVTINGKDYFLATDWEVKEFDGVVRPVNVGSGIYDRLRAAGNASLAYLQAAVGYYLQKWHLYVLVFQTAASTYEHWGLDLSQDSPGWVRLDWQAAAGADKAFTYFISTIDGRCLANDTATVYELGANISSDDSNVVYPVYQTNPILLNEHARLILKQICVTYKSDTAVIIDVYLNGSATAVTLASSSMDAQTTPNVFRLNMPMGTRCNYFALKFSLLSDQNSYLEIERVTALVEVEGGYAS